jgi:tetratricopeptide (TPR) repeat protein
MQTFKPYPDLITGRVPSTREAQLLRGMEAYRLGDFQKAADHLETYLEQPAVNKAAYLYLANCYLVLGRPYDAELQIDHLENSNVKGFQDQNEWYTVLCWLCSGQVDRARTGALRIAEGRPHTYRKEARDLVKDIDIRQAP